MQERKQLFAVQRGRKRVNSLSVEQRKQVVYLFDHANGDVDQVADRCGIIGIQRGDVLAIVLAETRKQPQSTPPGLRLSVAGRVA